PPCRSGTPAPLYPPDGFYGNLNGDPLFAAYLVQDVAFQFYGGDYPRYPLYSIGEEPFDSLYGFGVDNGDPIYGPPSSVFWVATDNIKNQFTGPGTLTAADFPRSGTGFALLSVTSESYPPC